MYHFANVVNQIWEGESSYISPKQLKEAIGEVAPQFSGYDQQDAHELIIFLLKAIHNEFNSHHGVVLYENIEGDGKNDEEISIKAWELFKKQNDSIIVDLFHGQLRSTIECPKCKLKKVIFDPYLSLTVPIAQFNNNKKIIKITYIPLNFSQPYQYLVLKVSEETNKDELCKLIKEMVATKNDIVCGYFLFSEFTRELNLTRNEYIAFEVFNNENILIREDQSLNNSRQNWLNNCTTHEESQINNNDLLKNKGEDQFNNFSQNPPTYYFLCQLKAMTFYFLYQSAFQEISHPFLIPSKAKDLTREDFIDLCYNHLHSLWTDDKETNIEISEDAQEIQKTILKMLEDDKNDTDSSNDSFISLDSFTDIEFKDYISTKIITITITKKGYQDPAFSFKKLFKNYTKYPFKVTETQKKLKLSDCLSYFSADGTLDESNQWYCPECQELISANKKIEIWSVPKCLIIHLNRFNSQSSDNYSFASKNTTEVIYDDIIDLSHYVVGPSASKSLRYQLKAVSVHIGTIIGGHYTAYALIEENFLEKIHQGSDKNETRWFSFNDRYVTSVSKSDPHTKDGYILFYELIEDNSIDFPP